VERISIMPGGMSGSTTTGMPENSMVFPNICSEARGRMSVVHSGLPSAWLRWLAIIAELVARHHEHGRRTEQLPAKVLFGGHARVDRWLVHRIGVRPVGIVAAQPAPSQPGLGSRRSGGTPRHRRRP
jgi:hypothetical protein